MGFCTEDRKTEGILPNLSVEENMTIAMLPKLQKHGFIDFKKQKELAKRYVELFNIKTPSLAQKIRNLSGGNQQKVFIARWLNTDADILLFDNPTQGIDVGAKAEIYKLILDLAKKGKTILVNTLEIPELQKVADSCVIFFDGRIIKVLSHDEIEEHKVMMYSTNSISEREA